MGIPRRVFLDTNVLNFTLDWGEVIFDGGMLPSDVSSRVRSDVSALRVLLGPPRCPAWELAISPLSYTEVTKTQDLVRRHSLQGWFMEIWHYWYDIAQADERMCFDHALRSRSPMLQTGGFDALPDVYDRMLLCDAVCFGCDIFCTRDWSTVLRHRDSVTVVPFKILTPSEWLAAVKPYVGLWA